MFGLSDVAIRAVVIVLAVGFIPVLVLAWAFEITPEGLKLERDVERQGTRTAQTGKKLDAGTALLLTTYIERLIDQVQAGDGVCV